MKGAVDPLPAASSFSPLRSRSNETLSSLYSSTIKMLQDNKINAKNSWSLNLLDHIDEIIEINDDRAISSGVKTNFQLAGCTLDAGARIYSHRVDSVHNNVFKVRGGLLLGREEEPEGDVDETEVQDGNELRKKAKKKTTQTSTLETNLDNITTTKVTIVPIPCRPLSCTQISPPSS